VCGYTGIDNVTWSPDGEWLAGTLRCAPQESERSGIFVMEANGTDFHWIVDVSPQGPRLGGADRAGLITWYSHGSAQPRRVVKTFTSLAWSPDGKTLAFSSDMDPSGAFYVYTISPQGGKPERLDVTKSAWPNEIAWQPRQAPPVTVHRRKGIHHERAHRTQRGRVADLRRGTIVKASPHPTLCVPCVLSR